jgi:hypothetical protein
MIVTWLKRPTYVTMITLIYKLLAEVLEITSEGSTQGKSQTPDLEWPSSILDHISVFY